MAASLLALPASGEIVVNEVGTNNPEFIELLVTADGNYQNWAVVDGLASGTVAGGGMKFVGPGFADLKAGALILVYAESIGEANTLPEDLTYDPDNGDHNLVLFLDSADTGDFGILGDTGLILGNGGEVVLVGDGTNPASPYATLNFVGLASPAAPYYDPAYFRFGLAAGTPQTTHSAADIDLPSPLDCAALGGEFDSPDDYAQSITEYTAGLPNTVDNDLYIQGLRGIEASDPGIFVDGLRFFSTLTAPDDESTVQIPITNTGATQNLTVTGSILSGPDATFFTVLEPVTIAPGGTSSLPVVFDPQGAKGRFEATLTVVSDDEGGAQPEVTIVGHSGDHADYEGLFIMEFSDAPASFRDEFVEIQNTSANPMDISGVLISDEESGTGEGVIRFPAGTVMQPGEIVLVLIGGTTAFQPNWYGGITPGVRVFYNSGRDVSGYISPDNPLIPMETVGLAEYGSGGVVFLGSGDSLALYLPGSPFDLGPVNANSAIDGVNFNNTSTGDFSPINSNGDFDTLETRVGSGSADPSILRRVIGPNIASNVTFRLATTSSPGVVNQLDDPEASADNALLLVDRILPTETVQVAASIRNLGAAQDLTVSGSFFTGTDATAFSVVSEPASPLGPDQAGDIVVEFDPQGATGSFNATLNVVSNDSSGDIVEIDVWAHAGDPAAYAGLWMTEIKYTTQVNQFVEIANTSSSAMDISGVQLTDSAAGNTEGTIAFPAGTVLAPGEVIVVTASPNLNRPDWIDSLPAGVRVFVNPARVEGAEFWFPANGNQLVNMDSVPENSNGGIFWLGSSDQVGMLFPGARVFPGIGPGMPKTALDGFNFDNLATGKPVPINPDGGTDLQETRFDVGAGIPTSVIRRIYDYSTSSQEFWEVDQVGITPGELRLVDDPDVQAVSLQAFTGRALPNATATGTVGVRNNGFTAPLTVSGSFFTGANASLFSVTTEPSGILPGEVGDVTFTFDPQGFTGAAEATLTLVSNDGGGDTIDVTVHAFSGDPAPYAGLWMSEVKTTPTADQFVEIVNLSGSAIDISGVQLTDSNSSNNEGCIAFPAGTSIAPGEHIVVTAGAGVDLGLQRPGWIDGIAGSTRVFVNPARIEAAEFWFPANGNQLINMDNVTTNELNGAGVFWLSTTGEVAMLFPGARIFNGVGVGVPGSVLDGLNLNNTNTAKTVPINPDGLYDTQETRLDTSAGVGTSAIRKTYATSTSSQLFWATPSSAITPGAENPEITSVDDWSLLAY